MTHRLLVICATAALLSACGDDGGKNAPDAGGEADAGIGLCGEFSTPATVLDSYPASYDGDLVGAGADLQVAEGICVDERDYYTQMGEDQVIRLDGLTPGAEYVIRILAAADVSFYVASPCMNMAEGPGEGECQLFVDQAGGREFGDFVAPEGGTVFVVIDQFSEMMAEDTTYTLEVYTPDCAESTECSGMSPHCFERRCVACTTPTHCTSADKPVCNGVENQCVAGFDTCDGDDDTESEDDGPVGAVELTPAEGTPAAVSANICSSPAAESDWFSVTLADAAELSFELSWSDEVLGGDLDLFLYDDAGEIVALTFFGNPEVIREELEPGTYYVQVTQFAPMNATATTPYTLRAIYPECESRFDCEEAGTPICSAAGLCEAGPDECLLADETPADNSDNDPESDADDGPAAATALTSGVAANSQICNTPGSEADFFSITVANGDNLTATLNWDDDAVDLDLYAFLEDGSSLGSSFWVDPEVVTLTHLPAGTVYFEVRQFSENPEIITSDYSLTVVQTAGGCSTVADCDDEFETQLFRGNCNGDGACVAIAGDEALANGEICDSADDCSSGFCSYILFQSEAATSECVVGCGSDADCTGALGEGYACTLVFQSNFCHPSCSDNLECGVNPGSDAIEADRPWDYLFCTEAGACDLDP